MALPVPTVVVQLVQLLMSTSRLFYSGVKVTTCLLTVSKNKNTVTPSNKGKTNIDVSQCVRWKKSTMM